MDFLDRMEIYIPVEAEVNSISLLSLPKSVFRLLSDSEGSRKLADPPEGIWICPAVLRRKGQKPASQTGNGVMETVSSLLGRERRIAQGPFKMSFVSSNRAAYKLLKDTMPEFPAHAWPAFPTGSAPPTYKSALFLYSGRIYLSIRRRSRSRGQRGARKPPQPASQSSIPSTSDLSSKSQRKRQPPRASLEPADKEVQRKRLYVSVPQISPKQPKDLLLKTDNHSTTDQELLHDHRPKKRHTTCKVTHSDNRKDVTHKGREVSSSKTARSVPQCTDGVHKVDGHHHKDAGGEQAAEEAAGPEPSWPQPQGEQQQQQQQHEEEEEEEEVANNDSEMQEDGEEAGSASQIYDMDSNVHTDRREPQGVASTAQQCDFNELQRAEEITLMKARLKQKVAALNNLPS